MKPKLHMKAPRDKMTELQRVQLLWPYLATGIRAFVSEESRRRCWDENREVLMRAAAPGQRPVGWWDYASPEPRDHAEPETEQLRRLGLLRPDEA